MTGKKNYQASDFDTSAKADELLCDLQRTAATNMLPESKYTDGAAGGRRLQTKKPPKGSGGGSGPPSGGGGGGGAPLSTASGIALSGMYIYNSLAGGNVDAVEDEIKTLDTCISHPSPFGEIHYHYWSPCIKPDMGFWDNKNAPPLCKDTTDCLNTP